MVTLTIELPDELYARLQAATDQAGESIETYTVRLLTQILMGPTAADEPTTDQHGTSVLR